MKLTKKQVLEGCGLNIGVNTVKKVIMHIRIYPIVLSKCVQKILYIHTGFNDRSFLWVVNGKIYDFLFFKIR